MKSDEPHRKISWAPRVQPLLVQRLYESDAKRVQSDELCDDVGIRLYLRCKSILQVSRNEVECPCCGAVFAVEATAPDEAVYCPTNSCLWQTTTIEYRLSWSKRRIFPGRAGPAFQEFYQDYPKARTYSAKILLIDRLIHSFHWDLKANKPNRSAANNLLEGNHYGVVAFLDALSARDETAKAEWRDTVDLMLRRRRQPGIERFRAKHGRRSTPGAPV